jgi:hypothetical protein
VLSKNIEDLVNKKTKEEDENKVRCEVCNKLFRGTEFMKKHIHTKHEELIIALIRDRIEEIMLENYLNDPEKLTNQLVYANDSFRGGLDRRKVYPKKRPIQDGPYEDLDDPSRFSKSRRVVDYSDL